MIQDVQQKEPDLKVDYHYKGMKIENLWKYNIRFINQSEKTLIGTSVQKNILTDYLTLNLEDGYKILDYKKVQSHFNHKVLVDSLQLKVAFEQWRPNEFLEYVFYIKTSEETPKSIPFYEPEFRQIVNGDIVFSKAEPIDENKRITEVVPHQGLKAGYIVSLVFTGLFIFAFTIVIILAPFSYYQANGWYKKNYPDFIQFIKETFPESKHSQNKYIDKPKELPSVHWNKFKGEKYPDLTVDFDFRKFYQFVITETILFAIDISLIITFIDLIYIFP